MRSGGWLAGGGEGKVAKFIAGPAEVQSATESAHEH